MAWVVDTSVLLDVFLSDPTFALGSADCLNEHLADGLTIAPVTYIELAPSFGGDTFLQDQFLKLVGIRSSEPWTIQDTIAAHGLWAKHVGDRRAGHATKRPVADILIAAFAQRFQGVITRNPRDFREIPTVVPR